MERKFKHTEDGVLKSLLQKKDVRVKGNCVQVLKSEIWDEDKGCLVPNPSWTGCVGNGTWGKIDFLVNHLGYTRIYVGKFS